MTKLYINSGTINHVVIYIYIIDKDYKILLLNVQEQDFMTNDYEIIQNPNEKRVVKKTGFRYWLFNPIIRVLILSDFPILIKV